MHRTVQNSFEPEASVIEREREARLTLYKPLNSSLTQIRLLELLPDNKEDRIRCRLHAPRFQYGGGYEALSYVWGNSMDEMKSILVDDVDDWYPHYS